ncbi:MAG: ATPase, T2SS/T4P/T4SS family [Planctomycetota bacterium]|jgi:type II secretory ATPase GspE/PulE/Tfp pilus assembly ATPase PilB-like protein|nr:ATPase, T2SS/T4P/T4SS family [Planctomycetota bacterium]
MKPDESRKAELIRFWRQLGLLLSSGVPLLGALKVIGSELTLPELKEAINNVHEMVRSGKTLSAGTESIPAVFSAGVVTLVGAGEAGGVLDVIAERIAKGLESGALDAAGSKDISQAEAAAFDSGNSCEDILELVSRIILDAVEARASDIHIEPTADGGHVRLRIDGVMQTPESFGEETYDAVVSRLMIMANVDVTEKRRPQDGRIKLNLKGKELDLRCSFMRFLVDGRNNRNYSVVMRILDRQAVVLDIEKVGMSPDALASLRKWTGQPNGIHIVTGPTGSGKTTLLYGLLQQTNRPSTKVMSIENPVEYLIPGVLQAEVQDNIGTTFPRLCRSFLRQDPDVILIGEIRDRETAIICVQASLTGHLILTSLHTSNATEVPRRLVDIGVEPWLVLDSLRGAASLRLVRKVCPSCSKPYESDSLGALTGLSEEIDLRSATFVKGKGCDECRRSGYRGRTAIVEIMPDTQNVRDLIGKNVEPDELREAAIGAGMVTMRHDGCRKAAQGISTLEEVLRVTQGMK